MASDRKRPELTIRPVIREGKVVTIDIGDDSLALIRPIPLEDFPAFYEKLKDISQYIDFGGYAGWNVDDLGWFLYIEITSRATAFLLILTEAGDWVNRKDILKEMKIEGRVLAGVLSSPGQYFTRFRRKPIYEKKEEEEEVYYRIVPEYLEMVKEAFEIHEE